MRFGHNEDLQAHYDGLLFSKRLNADVARLGILFPALQEGGGLQDFDTFCTVMLGEGIKPLITVSTQKEVEISEYVNMVKEMYDLHNKAIFQILNEPNNPDFGLLSDSYARTLCLECARWLPNTNLIGPSYSPVDNYKERIETVYKGGHTPVSLNIYPRKEAVKWAEEDFAWAKNFHKDVWVTELGIQKDYFPHYQVRASINVYEALKAKNAKSCIFHRLLEPKPQFITDWEKRNELWFINRDMTETKLYGAFKQERG